MPTPDNRIVVHIDKGIADRLREEAQHEHRTVSGQVEMILAEFFARKDEHEAVSHS